MPGHSRPSGGCEPPAVAWRPGSAWARSLISLASARSLGGELLALGHLRPLSRLVGLGVPYGHRLRVSGGAGGQRLVPLLAGPLQQAADLAVHPTKVVQQPVAELTHLVGLTHHRRLLLLHL